MGPRIILMHFDGDALQTVIKINYSVADTGIVPEKDFNIRAVDALAHRVPRPSAAMTSIMLIKLATIFPEKDFDFNDEKLRIYLMFSQKKTASKGLNSQKYSHYFPRTKFPHTIGLKYSTILCDRLSQVIS